MPAFTKILLRTKVTGQIEIEDLDEREIVFGNWEKNIFVKSYTGNSSGELVEFAHLNDDETSDSNVWSSYKTQHVIDNTLSTGIAILTDNHILLGDGANTPQMRRYVVRDQPLEVPDDIIFEFNTNYTPITGTEQVFKNGLLQTEGDDYTISGTLITFVIPPAITSKIFITYLASD